MAERGAMVISEGFQAVADGSAQEQKACGATGVGEPELLACLWIIWFLGCKVTWSSGKGVSLCPSDLCPAPNRSFLDTDFSGKILTPVSRAAA